jgi:hypothetical protein
MDTIIGLGKAGCNIARAFEKYPQYNVFKINTEHSNEKNYYRLEEQDRPEKYEENCPDLTYFFKYAQGETLFIIGGSSSLAPASLATLQQIKDKCNISILYVRSGVDSLTGVRKLSERTAYYVFQEYARSGVFDKMIIVENETIEKISGGLPVIGYHDSINEYIVSTLHMLNVFSNNKSLIDTFSEPHEIARICTVGMYNSETNQENWFFPLDNEREKYYYYAIPENKLKTDNSLLLNIREKMGEQKNSFYGIYSTSYEDEYVYLMSRSSLIQNDEKSA